MLASRILACCVALFSVAACGPSLKALEIRQADQAKARGDYVQAAEHLKRACELDPKDQKVCAEAQTLAAFAVRGAIAAAQTSIERGLYPEAIATLVKARAVDREGKVGPVLDEVATKVAEQCESHPLESIVDAVRVVRCLETHRVAIDRAAYADRVAAGRMRAAAVAARVAAASAQQDRPGSAYVQYGVAQCLSSSPANEAAKNQYYARFYERTSVPVGIRAHFPWTSPAIAQADFCAAVQAKSPIVACAGNMGARTLGLDLTVTTQRATHDVNAERREIEYVDHVETYENPDWRPLQDLLERTRRGVERQRSQAGRASADCDTAAAAWRRENSCNSCSSHTQRDAACNRADAAQQDLSRQVDEYGRLERQANGTPRTLQREIRDVFRYVESTHRYGQAYDFLGAALSEGRNQAYDRSDRVEYVVIEHVGFAKAGLAASPLVVPQPQQFRQEITSRAFAFAEAMAAAELKTRAAAKIAQCSNPRDPAQLDCWLEGQALQAADPLVPYTGVLADDVGKAFPPAGCK